MTNRSALARWLRDFANGQWTASVGDAELFREAAALIESPPAGEIQGLVERLMNYPQRMSCDCGELMYEAAEAITRLSQPSDDGDGPCFYCGEPTSNLAGDPGRWPLIFAQPDGTGVARYHHVRCVLDRLSQPSGEEIREAAAKIADAEASRWTSASAWPASLPQSTALQLAAAIRAMPLSFTPAMTAQEAT